MAKQQVEDKIKEVRVFHYPNATFYVSIPDLTPEEYERRMNEIKEAAANLLMYGKIEKKDDKTAVKGKGQKNGVKQQ